MKARPTMTPEEEAAWAAGVRSAAAGAGPDISPDSLHPVVGRQQGLSLAAAPRARVPVRRVRLQDEREVAP